jgi:1-aminocyclopropane-1-carboxylate deaminase
MVKAAPPDLRLPSPVVELSDDRLERRGVRVLVKRDDLIHPELPGNKWRKLKYNLAAAAEQAHDTLLTFGGAYSNHIRATAAAGHYFGFATIGVIRGEEHRPLNSSLAYAVDRGMRLTYLDRISYRSKHLPDVIAELERHFGRFYLLPEGGTNELALPGCAELPAEIDEEFDVICCPAGTGGTAAGIAAGLTDDQRLIAFSVLKGGDFLLDDIADLQQGAYGGVRGNWTVETGFHFGGYAKRTAELDSFVDDFERRHSIRLDWVYVAKMMYGLFAMIEAGEFSAGTRIVAVVTG